MKVLLSGYLHGILFAMLLALLIVPVSGSMSAPMGHRDLTGTNIDAYRGTILGSASECADLCDTIPECTGATYVLPNTFQGPDGHCWLKSAVTGEVENVNCISYLKQAGPTGGGCTGIIPQLKFSISPKSGYAPLTVQFTDQSTGALKYSWLFGEAGASSAEQNPVYIYTAGSPEGITYQGNHAIEGACYKQANKFFTVTVYDNAGEIDVRSNPPGATVLLNGKTVGTTHYTMEKPVPTGTYTVTLKLAGYDDYTLTEMVNNGVVSYLYVELVKKSTGTIPTTTTTATVTTGAASTGTLQVTTTPAGAAVYVDGVSKGTSPGTVTGLSPGSHTVRLTRAGYTDYQGTVTVQAGQTTPLTVPLVAAGSPAATAATTGATTSTQPGTGSISVTTNPAGASVDLDGWDKGVSPLTIPQVKAGSHTLTLKKTGYYDAVQTIAVSGGSTTPVTVTLVALVQGTPATGAGSGTLTIRSTPAGANIYLDGEKAGTTPFTVQNVPAGSHRLLLTLPGYADNSRTIDITAGSEKEMDIDFGRKSPGFGPVLPLAALAIIALVLYWRRTDH